MSNRYCSQCGAKLEEQDRFCTECGAPHSGQSERVQPPALPNNKVTLPVVLLAAGILLLVGGSLFYFFNRPEAVPAVTHTPTNVVESDIPFPEIVRISVEESQAQFNAGTAVILDVRPFEDYQTLHAANAVSIPLTELPDRYTELSPDAEILTYCTWPNEESSARAAAVLQELGFSNVKAIKGGFRAWQEADYPTASGS